MDTSFDLIVIGSGAAGGTAAAICSEAGLKVAVVDSNPFGGTCSLRGCVPKKVLVGEAETVDAYNRMLDVGVGTSKTKINWPQAIAFKNTFTEPTPALTEKSYTDLGITNVHGRAKFISSNQIQVGENILEGERFLLANGAKPMDLGMPGKEYVKTSDEFLDMKDLPESVIFIGGGFISFEFAHITARTGAQVVILDRGSTPLKIFDADLVEQMVKSSVDEGIVVKRKRAVEKVEMIDSAFAVSVKNAEGASEVFKADLVVHGAGRVPDLDDMNLEVLDVQRSRRGVVVNDYLKSVSNPSVYAAGDAAEIGPPLTPVALYQGNVVARNIIDGDKIKVDHSVVPSIVYTVPPIASVGILEDQAKKQGLDFRVNHQDTSQWYSSRRLQIKASSSKVIVDNASDKILGAHIFGPGAEELINVFAQAMKMNATASDLKATIFAYPTFCSDIKYLV